jgi:hypothetical protein
VNSLTPITEPELVRALGDEFESRDWDPRSDLPLHITTNARRRGSLDIDAAVALGVPDYLEANQISERQLRTAVTSVFRGRELSITNKEVTVVNNHLEFNGDNLVLSGIVAVGSTVTGSSAGGGGKVNIEINDQSGAPEVLQAVTALVTDALSTGYDEQKLLVLASVIEKREDLDQREIESAVGDAIQAADPAPSKLVELKKSVASSVISGILVHAIIAAIGAAPL